MTFEELKGEDKEGAFGGWHTVESAKSDGDIPEKFAGYFDNLCECGSENIVKWGLTQLTCCDPKCPIKQGYALAEMFTRFGIKGLKEATCSKVLAALKAKNKTLIEEGKEPLLVTDSYTAVLAIPFKSYPVSISSTSKGMEFFQACCKISSGTYTFAQLVSNLAIPGIGSDAEVLMAGISSPTELLDKIDEAGSVRAFCMKRGFYAEMVAFNLRTSLIDIVTAGNLLYSAVRKEGALKLSVCMTGAITLNGSKVTKEVYIKECNKLCVDRKGSPLFEIKMNTAIETNKFILYSRPSSDRKYVAGSRRGCVTDIFGTHSVLMHTDMFYSLLEEVMDRWNRDLDIMTKERMEEIMPQAMQAAADKFS